MGTESAYTVTRDNMGKTICLEVTVKGYNGKAVWEATDMSKYEHDVKSVAVVDGTDGYTPVTSPVAGQILKANVTCSDGTEIGTYPADDRVSYKWYYKESPDTVLGTESAYTVTSDNMGKTICLEVTVKGYNGKAVWEATAVDTTVERVKNVAELKAALDNANIETIVLGNNIETTEKINVTRPVTIDGNDKTLTGTDAIGWKGNYVLQVYGDVKATIKNITLTGGDAGLLVNGANVTLEGTVDVSDNEFGGIEVSKGEGVTNGGSLTIADGATVVNTSESYGKPTIWIDGVEGTDGTVTGGKLTPNTTIKENQTQYYLTAANVETVTVSTEAELKAALENEEIKTIVLDDDITLTEKLNVMRDITIDGNNKTLTGKNVAVGKWDGNYVLQVYGDVKATIKNITLTGGDAGLLVNGANVTLEGTVDVSDNEFGGIEVSKGEGVTNGGSLTIADGATVVNTSESYGKPTIWIDGVEGTDGTVTGGKLTPNTTIKENQVQYYLTAVEKTATVTDEVALKAALANTTIETIVLGDNITTTEKINVTRLVTIDGNDKTLTGTDVDGKWDSYYVLQVYGDGIEATIKNITLSGGDAGLLVNGSKVTLEGSIDVSGNEFGGIEVSKGKNVTTGGSLVFAVDADVVNDTEADGLPTIWIDKADGGTVTGPIVAEKFTEVKVEDKDQTHYYLDAANAPAKPTVAVELQPAEDATDDVEATEAE